MLIKNLIMMMMMIMLGKPRIRLNNLETSLIFPCLGLNPIIDSTSLPHQPCNLLSSFLVKLCCGVLVFLVLNVVQFAHYKSVQWHATAVV